MAIDSGGEGSDAEDTMLAALVELYRRNQRRSAGSAGDVRDARARIVAHFEGRGQRLRGERLVTAELIDRMFASSAAIPPARSQQEIRLEGPAGGEAAGRLRVTNRSAARARFDLCAGAPVEGDGRPQIRFEPASGELEPGASLLVRVAVALTGWSAGQRATAPVECRWREGRDRAWLVVVAHDGAGRRP